MAASEIDLISLARVKAWLGIGNKPDGSANTDDDDVIQFLITGFSRHVLNRSGVDSFTNTKSYTEIYDGNGRSRLFLRNTPIISVDSIVFTGYTLPQASSPLTASWYIEDSKKSIAFRTLGTTPSPYAYRGYSSYCFPEGQGNIQVKYTAGYTSVPEDLAEASMKVVAQTYKRKDWIGLKSKALSTGGGGSGTTTYQEFFIPPECAPIFEFYSRYARP